MKILTQIPFDAKKPLSKAPAPYGTSAPEGISDMEPKGFHSRQDTGRNSG